MGEVIDHTVTAEGFGDLLEGEVTAGETSPILNRTVVREDLQELDEISHGRRIVMPHRPAVACFTHRAAAAR